jgi:hypothetical protein
VHKNLHGHIKEENILGGTREVGLRKRRREAERAEREATLKKLQAASPDSDKQQRKVQRRIGGGSTGGGRGRGAAGRTPGGGYGHNNGSSGALEGAGGWGWGKGPAAPPIGVVQVIYCLLLLHLLLVCCGLPVVPLLLR